MWKRSKLDQIHRLNIWQLGALHSDMIKLVKDLVTLGLDAI